LTPAFAARHLTPHAHALLHPAVLVVRSLRSALTLALTLRLPFHALITRSGTAGVAGSLTRHAPTIGLRRRLRSIHWRRRLRRISPLAGLSPSEAISVGLCWRRILPNLQ
jgi:hypothetical protein